MKKLICATFLTIMILPGLHAQEKMEYHNLGGTVFGQQYPLENLYASLIYNYSDIYIHLTRQPFDTLGYYFFMNVPNGNYLVKAEPEAPGDFVPTYYGQALHWKDAAVIPLFSDQFQCDISLIYAAGVPAGTGRISGCVHMADKGPVPGVEILLMSPLGEPFIYRLSDGAGNFLFSDLAWGTYLVYPESEGRNTIPYLVTLDAAHSQAELWISMYESEIVAAIPESTDPHSPLFSDIYPMPASGIAFMDYRLDDPLQGSLSIFDLRGRQAGVSQVFELSGTGRLQVDLQGLMPGHYYLRVQAGDALPFVRTLMVTQD